MESSQPGMEAMLRRLDRWRGRVALVTGASSGIGRATALALAPLGMKVAIAGRRAGRLAEVAALVEAGGGVALPLPCDQTDMAANRRLFASVRETWGGVDVLINSAGVTCGRGVAAEDFATLEHCIDLNLKAALLCMREAAADLRRAGEGAIVNISSMTAHRVVPSRDVAVYAATKQALRTMTDGLRAEFAREALPVKVALISPGLTRTEFNRQGRRQYDYRPLAPEDVAESVLFVLAAPAHVQVCDILLRSVEQVD